MTRQKSFGTILREARERRGMDVPTAARRLRIRPDILQVIEAADFTRMPPRGYTRNMVHAYARMVGLNPTDLTRMYLDDDHDYQMSMSRPSYDQPARGARQIEKSDRRGASSARSNANRQERVLYEAKSSTRSGISQQQTSTRPGRRSNVNEGDSALPRFGNVYSGPKSTSPLAQLNHSKLPFIAIAGVLVLVVILIGVFVLGGKDDGGSSGGGSDVPISGLTDTSNPDTGEIDPSVIQNQQAIVITPDRVTFVYAVPAGSSAYIEVYESGKNGASVAQTVQGPSEKAFDVTETLTFVTSNPGGVIITEGNKVVEPTDENGDGVYIYKVDFEKYLADWKAEQRAKKEQAEANAKDNAAE